MTTITAIPDARTASVRLVISQTSKLTALVRADSNGTRPVRVASGTWPSSGKGELVITDYEPSLTGEIQYRAGTQDGENPSVWATMQDAADAPVQYLPRFMLPAIPYFSREVQTIHVYEASRASRSTVHNVLGRNDPIIVQGRLETRRGQLAAVFTSYAEALETIQILERGQAVFYRQVEHAGADMYFVASNISITPNEGFWIVGISFIEIDAPKDGIADADGWTFTKLAATGGTFDEVAQDYRSFTELSLGEAGV